MCYIGYKPFWKRGGVRQCYGIKRLSSVSTLRQSKSADAENLGCVRFVFNHFLASWKERYDKTGKDCPTTRVPPSFHTQTNPPLAQGSRQYCLAVGRSSPGRRFPALLPEAERRPRFKSRKCRSKLHHEVHEREHRCPWEHHPASQACGVRFAKSREVEDAALGDGAPCPKRQVVRLARMRVDIQPLPVCEHTVASMSALNIGPSLPMTW